MMRTIRLVIIITVWHVLNDHLAFRYYFIGFLNRNVNLSELPVTDLRPTS